MPIEGLEHNWTAAEFQPAAKGHELDMGHRRTLEGLGLRLTYRA